MLQGFLVILLFQSLGEVLSVGLRLQIPGHVIGMILLWAWLSIRGDKPVPASLDHSATQLLSYMALFFIPVCVGVIDHLDILQKEGRAIIWAMAIGLVVPLLSTTGVLEWWFRRRSRGEQS